MTYSRRIRLTNCFGERIAAIIADGRRDVDKMSWTKNDGRRLDALLCCELFPSQSMSSGFVLIVTCNWFGFRPEFLRTLLFGRAGSSELCSVAFCSLGSSFISDTRANRCGFISLQNLKQRKHEWNQLLSIWQPTKSAFKTKLNAYYVIGDRLSRTLNRYIRSNHSQTKYIRKTCSPFSFIRY